MKINSYAKNTMILFISMIITKVIGALFKIPLTNIIGGIGMGYYSGAYSLYMPVFAVTAAGIPTVIIKSVAQNIAASRYKNTEKVLRTALVIFGTIGLLGSALIVLLAVPFSEIVAGSPQCLWAILCISPSVFLCCISSVIKGYYEGLKNMTPTAVSQILEAVSRAAVGLTLSFLAVKYGMECYHSGMAVYGKTVSSEAQAMDTILPIAAACAVAAVTVSELCAVICLVIRKKLFRNELRLLKGDNGTQSFLSIAKELLKECFPVSLAAVAANLPSFIDLVTISRCLDFSVAQNSAYFASEFYSVISQQGGAVKLANFMYGSYCGIAGTVFGLIPAFTGMFGRSALPDIAAVWSIGQKELFKRKLSVVIKSNFIIGFPLYLGMAAMSPYILELLFPSRANEVAVSEASLFILCIGGVFLTLCSTFFSVFQVIGRSDLPVKLMLFSTAVKLIFNVFLIAIPQVNINGAAISTVISHAAAALGGYLALENVTGIDFHIVRKLMPPLVSGAICAFTAYLTANYVFSDYSVLFTTVSSVLCGAIVYIILLILSGTLHIKQLLNLQKNKK